MVMGNSFYCLLCVCVQNDLCVHFTRIPFPLLQECFDNYSIPIGIQTTALSHFLLVANVINMISSFDSLQGEPHYVVLRHYIQV